MSYQIKFTDFAARLRAFIDSFYPLNGAHRRATRTHADSSMDAPFNSLALELFALQFHANAPFQAFCRSRRISPEIVRHWTQIPAVPTPAFKEWELSCLPLPERTVLFLSSGTTGRVPSRHFHSRESLTLYEASLLPWFGQHLFGDRGQVPQPALADPQKIRLVSLVPSPAEAPHSSLAHMCETVRRQFGSTRSVCLANVDRQSTWRLDLDSLTTTLDEACAAAEPILLLGTAFSFIHFLDYLAEQPAVFQLPEGSRIMETGGYKGRSRALPKEQLHRLLSERLGIPASHIITEYGMSELSSQAYDLAIPARPPRGPAAQRRFRFPPWARGQVISPETGLEVEAGRRGLLRVFDLANVFSVLAVQTKDLALRRSDGFELLGRAAVSEPRGCSLMPAASSP